MMPLTTTAKSSTRTIVTDSTQLSLAANAVSVAEIAPRGTSSQYGFWVDDFTSWIGTVEL